MWGHAELGGRICCTKQPQFSSGRVRPAAGCGTVAQGVFKVTLTVRSPEPLEERLGIDTNGRHCSTSPKGAVVSNSCEASKPRLKSKEVNVEHGPARAGKPDNGAVGPATFASLV